MSQQITLKDCREKVLQLQADGKPFHFYYKHLLDEETNEVQSIFTEDLGAALTDKERYGSLFFRTGREGNIEAQYQVISDTEQEPI